MNTSTILPGFFAGLAADEYHALNCASKSKLAEMAPPRTPAHLKWLMDYGREPVDCLRVGDAGHALVLEPDRFIEQYTITGLCHGRKADGQECQNSGKNKVGGHWYCGVHTARGAVVDPTTATVSQSEFEMLKAMRKAIRAHPAARRLMDADGFTECSCVWTDPDTGEACKCRPDRLVDVDGHTIADLKTTLDASPEGFGKQVMKHLYHLQAAMYMDGVRKTRGHKVERFVFIAVEKKPPYLVAVYETPNSLLIKGGDLYRELLDQYHQCRTSGKWPGYGDEMQDITVPMWAQNEEITLSIGGESVSM
jgi:exodeoxyribonuclease VIII